MKGDLKIEIKKNNKKFIRKLNPNREYISANENKIKLNGTTLMLNRNVGHLMTNPSILLKDGSEIPEGILDAFITVAASIHDFSYGVSARGASIRIPIITVEKGWKGWLEDRRPASNGDPYKIAGRIVKTVKSAKI